MLIKIGGGLPSHVPVIFSINGLNRKGNLGHAWPEWKRPKPLVSALIPGTLCPMGTNIVTILIVTLPC